MFKEASFSSLPCCRTPRNLPYSPTSLDKASPGSNPQPWLLEFETFVFIVLYLCAPKGASRVLNSIVNNLLMDSLHPSNVSLVHNGWQQQQVCLAQKLGFFLLFHSCCLEALCQSERQYPLHSVLEPGAQNVSPALAVLHGLGVL